MKLTKKHIGRLVTNDKSDGSWVYQLVDVNKTHLLFYDFTGDYCREEIGKYDDWQLFRPRKKWPKDWLDIGWPTSKEIE